MEWLNRRHLRRLGAETRGDPDRILFDTLVGGEIEAALAKVPDEFVDLRIVTEIYEFRTQPVKIGHRRNRDDGFEQVWIKHR